MQYKIAGNSKEQSEKNPNRITQCAGHDIGRSLTETSGKKLNLHPSRLTMYQSLSGGDLLYFGPWQKATISPRQ